MLDTFSKQFHVLASQPPAEAIMLSEFIDRFPNAPKEYTSLVEKATELEIQHQSGQYIRIWGPSGCLEMDDAYDISSRIPGAIPIGDDGGGRVILYMNGKRGRGLYHVAYGNLDAEDAVYTAPTLMEFLQNELGITTF